jgi:uncharacterized membrane protein HdeD (DUF308 family)
MRQVFVGAALVIAGIAAFIEAYSHPPELESRCRTGGKACPLEAFSAVHIGLSKTAYDLLRIGAWALVIVGVLLVVTGLIAYWGAQARRSGPS